jgi:hypothetical protein
MAEVQLPAEKRAWYIPSVFGITVGIIIFLTTFVINIKADDIWWHLKAGEYILTNMGIPDQNIFSFTAPDHHWLPHEWLSEVVFYLIYRAFGMLGLIAFGILLNAVACGLVYKLTMRYSRSPYLSSLITLLAALMMLGNFSLRPYLFGNLFFIFTLHAMEEPTAGGRLRPALIFLLFSSWANFHGSFLLGLALILLYLFAGLAAHLRGPRRSWAEVRSLLLDFGVALAACMVTPNHVFGLIFPLAYVQRAFSGEMSYLTNISEWQPAGFRTPLGQMITFYVMFCMFALLGSGRAPRATHIGMLVAFAVFSFATIRNIPLLGIAATPILARHLPLTLGRTWRLMTRKTPLVNFFDRIHERSVALNRRSYTVILPTLWVVLLVILFALPPSCSVSYRASTGTEHLADLSPGFYPQGLIEKLDQRGSDHRIFNYFNWGGAFIWALYPKERVFIDQRNDCYPIEIFQDYFAVHKVERDWRVILDRWDIDTVAYPADSRLAEALRNDLDWAIEYEDDQAVLFSRP